ncbi:sensor histidine kinase [Tunicatimonas pelagia]|uniref:sensor histidine kinase n=1 Tax=Tunicatimonas pelagia TaxID=931531 RepID=UPI0026663F92|nr:histidine kinase [Tunicatimonas pelagia]WKN42746.1 histidine kinase [Tunicatimonas pelagia]
MLALIRDKYINVLFHLFIILLMVMSALTREGNFTLDRGFYLVLIMIPFYFININYLVPLFLKKGNYGMYAFVIFASYLLFLLVQHAAFQGLTNAEIISLPRRPPRPGPPPPRGWLADIIPGFGNFFLFLHFMVMILLGVCFEMIMEWEKQKRRYQESQKEKASTELSFLKSQINPHFFFNTLNNIYALAAAKSDNTEEAILMLSSMMRYVLYEAGTDKIELTKEVRFIENYISLQQIRFSAKKDITISLDISGAINNFQVAPMLFLPILENAFKHGISYKEKSFVAIYLYTSDRDLQFTVENSIPLSSPDLESSQNSKSAGIGLENIRKRLQLLYPDTHEFETITNNKEYMVQLKLYQVA